jgi:REP element-mobilizing transposase RayT
LKREPLGSSSANFFRRARSKYSSWKQDMIHAYHATFGTYGSWFPNDPRGSASNFVGSKRLYARGDRPDRSLRLEYARLTDREKKLHRDLQFRLKHPAVVLSDGQRFTVAKAIEDYVRKTGLAVWAAAIMPCHIHLVFARCGRKAETIVDEIKTACEEEIRKVGRIQNEFESEGNFWADGRWICYQDSELAIEAAILYVEDNPIQEGHPKQIWPFVVPFPGIEPNIVSYLD